MENKQLRHELKVRGWSPQPPDRTATRAQAAPAAGPVDGELSDEQREVVDRFHMLYRDGLRLDKKTYWRGARVIKCPLDLWIYQELISELRPDLVIETGTMYGGSAFYFASILDLVGHGEILTVDRNHREGRPEHPRITYMSGRSSTDPGVLAEVGERAAGKDTVMVLLDSNHKAQHVLQELRSYHPLVTPGSYLVVEDTNINGHPVEDTFGPGPMEALRVFLGENDDFEIDRECEKFLLTFNPDGWLRRKTPAS
jgi:cephalosporin hydroxylase